MKKTPREYLLEEWPNLNKELEGKRLRGHVCTVMEEYASLYLPKWIKIESEKDLPKQRHSLLWVYTDKGNIYNYFLYATWLSINGEENITHYAEIIKPEPPKED